MVLYFKGFRLWNKFVNHARFLAKSHHSLSISSSITILKVSGHWCKCWGQNRIISETSRSTLTPKEMKVLVTQSCLTLCDPTDCTSPGSSVHGILQTRILEWVAISFSRGSSWPRDGTWVSCIAGRFFTAWATREALYFLYWPHKQFINKDVRASVTKRTYFNDVSYQQYILSKIIKLANTWF